MNAHDQEEGPHSYPLNPRSDLNSSPPLSFRSRSRSSSPSSRRLLQNDPLHNNEDQTLADAFGDEDESDDDNEPDDRQRLMRADPDFRAPADNAQSASSSSSVLRDSQDQTRSGIPRRPTMLPTFTAPTSGGSRQIAPSNDGVFANLNAKPERNEKNEDLPPVSWYIRSAWLNC